MIILTRLNGPEFALNPDLIERADCTPDTVLTLVDGTKYIIAEPLAELARRIRVFRASIIAEAQQIELAGITDSDRPASHRDTRTDHREDNQRHNQNDVHGEIRKDPARHEAVVVQMHRREH